MNKEALKLAIQLRDTVSGYWTENEIPIIEKLIELLAHPAQEPVAWMYPDALCDRNCLYVCTKAFTQFPECATTPPQRPWVGLTAEEAAECWTTTATQTWKNFENALRNKNT